MASQLASGDLVSDRYASALYDLATEKNLIDPVLNDLSNLKNILKDNKELSLVVKSPLIIGGNPKYISQPSAAAANIINKSKGLLKISIAADTVFSPFQSFISPGVIPVKFIAPTEKKANLPLDLSTM